MVKGGARGGGGGGRSGRADRAGGRGGRGGREGKFGGDININFGTSNNGTQKHKGCTVLCNVLIDEYHRSRFVDQVPQEVREGK